MRVVVRIDDDGSFAVSLSEPAGGELTGTWAVDDGDLSWRLDGPRTMEPVVVRDVDALTLESTRITLEDAGFLEANDGGDDPDGEQPVDVEAHGTDSVTLTYPGGTPWTCDRR